MSERIVLLGTGTCQLQTERVASSVLLELEDLRLVYDFGRGVCQRLAELGLRQADLHHVVLSHFHPDHLSDLIPYLHAASWSRLDPRRDDLHLHGPAGLEVQLMRLLSLFDPGVLTRETFRVHLHEVPDGELTLGSRSFVFRHLPPANNHGLKLRHHGRTYALTGDSSFHAAEVEFLRDVDLAVIDAGHLDDEEIVTLAVTSGARRLVCSHLYRELDGAALAREAAARGYRGEILVGRDLMSFPL